MVEANDIDGLIDLNERIHAHEQDLKLAKWECRMAMVRLSTGDAKTRRIVGRRTAKLTMPDDSWDQRMLKDLWQGFPDLSKQYLRIDRVGVRMREYKKIVSSSGDETFMNYRKHIMNANLGPQGIPRVEIEE